MMDRHTVEPDENGCFESQMVFHMRKQTKFLEDIHEAIKAVKTVLRFISSAIGFIIGGFGLWEYLKQFKH